MVNVSNTTVDRTVFTCIDPIPHDVNKGELSSWIDQVNTLAYSYQRVSNSRSEVFWSTLLCNTNFMFSFDSALENIPKGHSLERFELVHKWNIAASKAIEALRFQIVVIYCRIQVFPSKIDSTLTKANWMEYSQKIMPSNRAALVWALFPQKTELFAKIVTSSSKHLVNPAQSIRDLASDFRTHYEQAVQPLFEQFTISKGASQIKAAGLIRKYLFIVADAIYTCIVSLDVLRNTGLLKDPSPIVIKVPRLVEAIGSCFPVGILMDIAAILPGWPMRNLLRINSHIEQGAVKLFKKALDLTNNEDRFEIASSSLACERFLFIDKDIAGFTSDLSKFKTDERRQIEEALQKAIMSQSSKVAKHVEQEGLLQSLGEIDRLQPEQRRALDELKDVFQHMSIPYLHLCLRHFDYNACYAIESMLSADHRMPLELRQMEILAHPSSMEPTLPTLAFKELDLIKGGVKQSKSAPELAKKEKEQQKTETKNAFKGLFSLALASPPSVVASTSTESIVSTGSTLPKIIESLGHSLDRSKARSSKKKIQKEEKVYEGVRGEKLVPMRPQISNFKITQGDKIAIRPTYEQYKYESHFDEDDYNDEYDDGYEGREFQIEPLNEPLSEEESEEEGEKAEGTSNAPTRGGGQGRGRGRGHGGGNRGGKFSNNNNNSTQAEGQEGGSRNSTYTGGRQRQMKERHKNEWKQRGADKKRRGAFMA